MEVSDEPGDESETTPTTRRGGPVTEEGKAVVCQNAFKHGLRATDRIFLKSLEEDEREDFQAFRAAIWEDVLPGGALEETLTDKLCIDRWRQFRLYLMNRATFRQSLHDWPNRASDSIIESMEKLGRYEACLERSFKTSLHELQRLQAAKRGQPVLPPVAVDINVNGLPLFDGPAMPPIPAAGCSGLNVSGADGPGNG